MQYTIEAKSGGTYDVIVAGGGTAGVIAAIATEERRTEERRTEEVTHKDSFSAKI